MSKYVDSVLKLINEKYPWEKEFLQAATEVLESLRPVAKKHPELEKFKVLERLVVPERIISFRVPWISDNGEYNINHGFRIQFNSALGPYKGGLRLHPTVTQSVLKFLGFEQIFKNALTGLPMGAGKGGSDFDPKGKSDAEVMRFCQSFMSELFKYIGQDTDVPAGDIGTGGREIGFFLGQYKKLAGIYQGGVLTGKSTAWGGSLGRPEATGHGCVYFAQEMLNTKKKSFKGKTVLVSGSGNVAQYAINKVNQLGGKVVSASDSSGCIIDEEGITGKKWEYLLELKNVKRGRISEYAKKFKKAKFHKGKRPWGLVKADVALPCATQNELELKDAKALVKNECICVCEGANMPTTLDATKFLINKGVLFGPGKAANAGGVAVSGLEMSQNSMRLSWTAEEVDEKLKNIMKDIHKNAMDMAKEYGTPGNYVNGANIAGFWRVARAMLDQGLI